MNQLSLIGLIALSAALLAGCATQGGNTSQQQSAVQQTSATVPAKPSGTVQVTFTHVAFIGSGARGNGILNFQGKQYPFEVTGLGVSGTAVARVNAVGEVYGLNTPADFAGAYVQEKSDLALGDTGRGGLWLRNEHGVIMRLNASMTGAALTLGADAVRVSMRQ